VLQFFINYESTKPTKWVLKKRRRVSIKEAISLDNEIVVYNDDVNTFDHVIETLIRVCNHTPEQAEQCSLIVHYNGKCTVKTGHTKIKTTMHSIIRGWN
jgi:ATP-dependent Clp protease adaptor protein ClpS